MAFEVDEIGDMSVALTYKTEDGGTATAIVIGLSVDEVEGRKKEFADAHDLEDKAQREQ